MAIESVFAVLMPTQTLYEVDERAVNHDSGTIIAQFATATDRRIVEGDSRAASVASATLFLPVVRELGPSPTLPPVPAMPLTAIAILNSLKSMMSAYA